MEDDVIEELNDGIEGEVLDFNTSSFTNGSPKPKKTINEQIKELSDRGYDIEMIARELGLTTTEVQFSLDMGF